MTSRAGLIPIPFNSGFYQSRSKQFASQRLINWYVNYPESTAINDYNLYHSPGLVQRAIAGGDVNRGAHVMNGKPYFVNGQRLYRLDRVVNPDLTTSYQPVDLGKIEGSSRVQMAAIAGQLCIVVPGEIAYICNSSGALNEIVDPDFDGPVDDVVALDSVFVFCKTDSNIIFHSDLNDGLSYGALDSYPVPQLNKVVGLGVFRNQLYVFGEKITVPFANVGGLQFLFDPIPNAVIDTGLATKYTKSKFKDSLVWLGAGDNEESALWLYSGGAPRKISTEPIDYIVQNLSPDDLSRAFILRHSQNGADFIVLNISGYSLKYDFSASMISGKPEWHEQRSRIPSGADYLDSVWRVNSIVKAYDKVFVGDSVDGRIGEISEQVGTEYGINMACVWESSPLSNSGVRGKVWAIEVFTDVGLGNDDPVSLSWSDDSGFTWSNKIERSSGAVGEYGRRLIWDRLGMFSLARMLRVEYSGSYPRAINKVLANAQ